MAQEPDQDAADLLKEIVNQRALGQHGRVWDQLHPFHQAVVTRARYVDCESRSDDDVGAFTIEKNEVVDQYDEPVRIPGQPTDVPSKAVTLRLTVSGPGLDKPQTYTRTAHAVAVGRAWHWVLTPEDYRAYKAHRCPPSE